MCPSRWFTPMKGTSSATATAFAAASPTSSAPRTRMSFTGPRGGERPPRSLRPETFGCAAEDLFELPPILGGADGVHPHHQGILSSLLVVVLPNPHRTEPEPVVQALGTRVRHPD